MKSSQTTAVQMTFRVLVISMVAVLCALPAFAGTATVHWGQPTTHEDGTPLTDLAGYKVHYGTTSGVYTTSLDVGNVTTYQVQNLTEGATYFFAVTDYTTGGSQSAYSAQVSKTIPFSQYALSVAKTGTGTGSVLSSPAGLSCGSTCSASFAAGSTVTLSATADASSVFSGWSGACTGTGSCTVTMNAARSVTAAFALKTFTITASAGANGSLSPSGAVSVNYGAATAFTITPAAGYHVADVLVDGVSVGAVTSYSFTNVTANHTISAAFAATIAIFTVTPSAGANGTISPSTPQTVNQSSTTSFTVTPNAGYAVSSVTGCGGTLNGTIYTTGPVTANCTVLASFAAAAKNTLTVTRTGNGTVVSAPAGIDCGQVCSSAYTPGTSVALTATPAAGWSFTGWSGACSGSAACSLSMDSARSVAASFQDVQKPALSVSALPDGSVTKNQDLNVSGTVTDNSGLKSLVINGSAATVQGDGTFSALVILLAGRNTVTTVATDLAGNTTSDVRTITLDQTAPGITITSPADNGVTATSSVNISGTVSEAATVAVSLNGGSPQLAPMNGTSFFTTIILSAGQNTILITATDAAGNASGAEKRTIVYDDKKPAVSIKSPSSDTTTAKKSVAIEGQVVDSLTASTAVITVDGVTTPLPLDATGNFSTTAVFADEGAHTVLVTATNEAGVSADAQRNIQYTMYGDLNGSGGVDIADAVLAFRHVTGAGQITDPAVFARCDVAPLGTDGRPQPDGKVDLADVVIILRNVAGLVNW